jgi:predicted phage-related endonuclease
MNAPAINLHGSDEAFRGTVVGASEVAALFDASPFCTRFELWHRKRGTIAAPEFGGNERIEWGIRLERPIIDAAIDRYGYEPETTPQRLDNGAGLGGHPDQFVICPDRGPGLLEVKTADWLVAKKWGEEPPLHYLLQMQAYLGLAGRAWADLIVLVGGNELRRFPYEFRPKIYADIERRVTEFWQSVRANDPPQPDFARDGEALAAVIGEPTEEVADLRHDNAADDLACEWLNAKAAMKQAEQRVEEAKNALLLKIGTAGMAMLPCHRISAGMTKGSADKEITAEMVGQVIKGRKGYRRFDIKEWEGKA